MIAWPDGSRDDTTRVRWLQGLTACIDFRQPAAAADFPRVRALDDLSTDQCAWLAQQQGFSGHLTFDAGYFEWTRSIDYQPRSSSADAGSLRWQGEVLVERGRDIDYVEHWHRDTSAPAQPTAAVALRDACANTPAALLRVGTVFMFARDRTAVAAGQRTLGECVAGAPTLRHAQQLVDCEISFGKALPAGLQITESTLPYRIGNVLDLHFIGDGVAMMDRAPNGAAVTRRWEITASEGNLDALTI
jgi:hypothetical protein